MKTMNSLWIILWCIIIISILAILLWPKGIERQLNEAYASYEKGEKADTIAARKESFNRALSIYTDIEDHYDVAFSDGKLYYNIANTYFQLQEYPLASLYYYRAIALMPRNDKVKRNLDITLAKLSVPSLKEESIFKQIFFFHYYLSLPERLQLFFILGLLGTICFSLSIWFSWRFLKSAGFLLAICEMILLLSLAWTFYLAPVEGVLTHATILYRDAGFQYAPVSEKPALAGVKVEVVDVLQEGKWLKILTPNGSLGYVPQDSIRLI